MASTNMQFDSLNGNFITLLRTLDSEKTCAEFILWCKEKDYFVCKNGCNTELNYGKKKSYTGQLAFYCKTCNLFFTTAKFFSESLPKVELQKIIINGYLFSLKTRVWQNIILGDTCNKSYTNLKNYFIKITKEQNMLGKMGGLRQKIQVDETACCRRKTIYNPTSMKEEIRGTKWIVGLYCETTKRKIIELLPNRKIATFTAFFKKHVHPGSKIYSDGYPSYPASVKNAKCEHIIVDHSKGFRNSNGDHTNSIESVWSILKTELRSRRGVVYDKLEDFVTEMQVKFDNMLCICCMNYF